MRFLVCVTFCFLSMACLSQAIDNTASFRIIDAKKYTRLHYENDYFTATDRYYTQGINAEIVAPSFNDFFLSRLLLAPKSNRNQFGLALEHNGYTPTSIESNDILYGDRPFAAALMLKSFSMSADSVRHQRITSSLTLGIIGPGAGGYEMQRTIHRWINGQEPFGWQYQIQNDMVINYQIGVEKNVIAGKYFLLNVMSTARLGTLDTKLSGGAVIMIGRFNQAISRIFSSNSRSNNKVYFHLFAQPLVNLVAYDATLQGGLFNTASVYTISPGQISRATFEVNYGGVLSFGSVQLEYFKTFITREFETATYHRWGGIRVGVKLR